MSLTTCYGKPTGAAFLCASGYGKNRQVTEAVDILGIMLSDRCPHLPLEKRCNSDGESGGVWYDGKYCFGLNANAREGFFYEGCFCFSSKSAALRIPHSAILCHLVVSPQYKTPQEALSWLLKFCSFLKQETRR